MTEIKIPVIEYPVGVKSIICDERKSQELIKKELCKRCGHEYGWHRMNMGSLKNCNFKNCDCRGWKEK